MAKTYFLGTSWARHFVPALCCLLLAWQWTRDADGPVVSVEQGLLRGLSKQTQDGIPYFSFKGIPYAKPPVGELRFKAPEPPDNWTDVRLAHEEGPMCCQPHTEIYWLPKEFYQRVLPTLRRAWFIVSSLPRLGSQILRFWAQSEDCLYLNVYTKQLEPATPQPVVVFIHGGAFYTGTANSHIYGPDYLLREDVVLVTVAYRLGALGFLAVDGSSDAPGNAGLKDQAMALLWVQRNIARFGGDPGRVTLIGHSAGAAAVHYHTLSPASRGLFHRAIQLSGTAFNSWAYAEPEVADQRSRRLASLLGFNGTAPDQLVNFLRTKTPHEIINASYSVFADREHGRGYIAPFVPTSDRPVPPPANSSVSSSPQPPVVQPFLTGSPLEAMRRPDYNPPPTIIGSADREGILVMLPDIIAAEMIPTDENLALLEEDFERVVPSELKLQHGSKESKLVADMMRKYYFGEKRVKEADLENYVDIFGHLIFSNGISMFMRHFNELSSQQAFCYRFTFDGLMSVVKQLVRADVRNISGVSHGDDLGYIFPVEMMPAADVYEGSDELRTRDRWVKFIANFARTGNPTPDDETDPLLNITWTPSTTELPTYLDFRADLKLHSEFANSKSFDFWKHVFQVAGRDIMTGELLSSP